MAASGKLRHETVDADDKHVRAARILLGARKRDFGLWRTLFLLRLNSLLKRLDAEFFLSERHAQIINAVVAQTLGKILKLESCFAQPRKLLVKLFSSGLHLLGQRLSIEPLAHFGAGAGADRKAQFRIEPVA